MEMRARWNGGGTEVGLRRDHLVQGEAYSSILDQGHIRCNLGYQNNF